MNALNRLKQLLGLPEDAAEETLQAELDKLESLLTPANPAASDPPALPGQAAFFWAETSAMTKFAWLTCNSIF